MTLSSAALAKSHFLQNVATEPQTFDGDAFTGPLLLEGGEAFPLPDADDVLLEVKLLCVEAQEAKPQLPH